MLTIFLHQSNHLHFSTVYKIQERHDVLSRTIGYLDEEQEALDRGYLLLICSIATMVVGSLLQILFFYLYNGPFHPFANILVDFSEGRNWYLILYSDCICITLLFALKKIQSQNPMILQSTKWILTEIHQLAINQPKQKKLWTCPRNLRKLKLSMKKDWPIPCLMKPTFETWIGQDYFIVVVVFILTMFFCFSCFVMWFILA